MRLRWFLAPVLALALAACSYLDLAAGCRCERGSRREARQARKAARRGVAPGNYCTPAAPATNPYADRVDLVGQVDDAPRFKWECKGGSCKLVRVAPVPTPDPKFSTPIPPAPPPQAPEPSATNVIGGETTHNDSLRALDQALQDEFRVISDDAAAAVEPVVIPSTPAPPPILPPGVSPDAPQFVNVDN